MGADEFERSALRTCNDNNYAVVQALLAISARLEEHNTQLTELVRLAREGREAWDATQS